MLTFLPGPVQGAISLLMLAANTIVMCMPLFIFAILKFIIPIDGWRRFCTKILNGIANTWVWNNNTLVAMTKRIRWDVRGLEDLRRDNWYLVVSNHQSWLDIVVLQKVMHRKIPFLKFFLKKELIYVPLLGIAWWALDFPFMKRYSKDFLRKKPHLKGKDLETTKKACQKFKTIPVSVMNFVEGTRFTCEKKNKQQSPYKNLLKPKAAGMAFVLGAMGEQLDKILNVTIVYPNGYKSLWDFLCGKIKEIKVNVETLPIKKDILGDYSEDDEYRKKFQDWLNTMWSEKDLRIASMLPALPCPESMK